MVDRLFEAAEGLPRNTASVIALNALCTLSRLAGAVLDDPGLLGPHAGAEGVCERLQTLPGIGPWTAAYVAMRALGEPDAFPAADLGLLKATGLARASEVTARAEAWRPWRAYAAMHLWHSLAAGG